jgi:hypothetical protein
VPVSVLGKLAGCAGRWQGTNRLHDPHSGAPEDSPSTLTVTPLLESRFVRMDYTCACQGAPQEGSLLVGYENEAATVTAFWIDTWHMSDKVMASRGAGAPDGSLVVKGSYSAPPGPDWGWRTLIAPGEGGLGLVMHNTAPDGGEELAVEASDSPQPV